MLNELLARYLCCKCAHYGAYFFFASVSQLLLHFLCSVSEIFHFQFQLVYWLFWYDLKHTVWTHTLGCLIKYVNLSELRRKINIFISLTLY
jgi:hypothetical protein